MKDETYLYMSDVKDRAKVARNSRYKKNGCKSKKCTLPTDYKTRKEIAAMNGEVKSFKMTEFYSWDDFLKMSNDIQKEYIERIIKKYQCSLSAISIEVFGKSPDYLVNYLAEKKILIPRPKVTG